MSEKTVFRPAPIAAQRAENSARVSDDGARTGGGRGCRSEIAQALSAHLFGLLLSSGENPVHVVFHGVPCRPVSEYATHCLDVPRRLEAQMRPRKCRVRYEVGDVSMPADVDQRRGVLAHCMCAISARDP